MVCFILQGGKRVAINDKLLSYGSDQYLINALDLPLIGKIRDAEDGLPYIAISLELEPAILAEVMSSMSQVSESQPDSTGIALNIRWTLIPPQQ